MTNTTNFNPHNERTADDVLIVPNLRVFTNNLETGTVVRDRDYTPYSCQLHPEYHFKDDPNHKHHGCYNGWDHPNHWFDVRLDSTGGTTMMDGSRLAVVFQGTRA